MTDRRDKQVFITVFVAGFLVHGFRFANKFFCEDALHYLDSISAAWSASLGRYLLGTVEYVRGPREITWFIGVLCLLWIALAAVFIVRIFGIRDKHCVLLTSVLLVVNPVVTGTFAFLYTADGYFFGMMLSVLAVFILEKSKKKISVLYAALSIAASMGFYQSYLSVTIVLMMMVLMLMLLGGSTLKETGMKALRFLMTGACAVAIYFPAMIFTQKYLDVQMADYQGINGNSSLGIGERLVSFLKGSYVEFARFFLVRWKFTFYNVTNVLLFVLIAVLIFMLLADKKLKEKAARAGLVLLLLLLLPLATHIFLIISNSSSYISASTGYSMCLLYVLPLILYEKYRSGTGKEIKKFYVGMSVFIALICFCFGVTAGQVYENMYRANVMQENEICRVQVRAETLSGYHPDMKVAVYGCTYKPQEYIANSPMMPGAVSDLFITEDRTYVAAMNWYLSTEYTVAGEDIKKDIVSTDEFGTMQMWPAQDSVRIIDDTLVIWFDDRGMEKYL